MSERCLSEQMLECEDRVREAEKTSHLKHKELIDELATRNKEVKLFTYELSRREEDGVWNRMFNNEAAGLVLDSYCPLMSCCLLFVVC